MFRAAFSLFDDGGSEISDDFESPSVADAMDRIRETLPSAELLDEQQSSDRTNGQSAVFWDESANPNLVGLIFVDRVDSVVVGTITSPAERDPTKGGHDLT